MSEPSRELVAEVLALLKHVWTGEVCEFKAVGTRKGVDIIIGHKRRFDKSMSRDEIRRELKRGTR